MGNVNSNPATLREAIAKAIWEALAASGTEAAPPDKIKCFLTREQFDAMMSGKFNQPAQAASPEGERREVTKAEAEVWLERNGYPYLEQMFNEFVDGPISRSRMNSLLAPLFVKYAALRQSAAPSGPLDTPQGGQPSHLAGQSVELLAARLDEAEWWEHLVTEPHEKEHASECMYCLRILELKRAVLKAEQAVAMQTPAPQQLQAESKTGAAPDISELNNADEQEMCRVCGNENCECTTPQVCPTCGYARKEWRGEAACNDKFHQLTTPRKTGAVTETK